LDIQTNPCYPADVELAYEWNERFTKDHVGVNKGGEVIVIRHVIYILVSGISYVLDDFMIRN